MRIKQLIDNQERMILCGWLLLGLVLLIGCVALEKARDWIPPKDPSPPVTTTTTTTIPPAEDPAPIEEEDDDDKVKWPDGPFLLVTKDGHGSIIAFTIVGAKGTDRNYRCYSKLLEKEIKGTSTGIGGRPYYPVTWLPEGDEVTFQKGGAITHTWNYKAAQWAENPVVFL